MLQTFPDFDKITPPIMAGVNEKLASLAPEMLERVCSITEGLPSRCRYFPTVFDITELVKEIEIRDTRHRPVAPTGYKYFEPEPDIKRAPEETRRAHAQQLVAELKVESEALHTPPKPVSDPDAEWRKPGPPSKQLVSWLREQGWPHLPPDEPQPQEATA